SERAREHVQARIVFVGVQRVAGRRGRLGGVERAEVVDRVLATMHRLVADHEGMPSGGDAFYGRSVGDELVLGPVRLTFVRVPVDPVFERFSFASAWFRLDFLLAVETAVHALAEARRAVGEGGRRGSRRGTRGRDEVARVDGWLQLELGRGAASRASRDVGA